MKSEDVVASGVIRGVGVEMEMEGSSQPERTGGMRGFPGAAQPEVMRAAEKDEHYVTSLCDACYEAFRHAVG